MTAPTRAEIDHARARSSTELSSDVFGLAKRLEAVVEECADRWNARAANGAVETGALQRNSPRTDAAQMQWLGDRVRHAWDDPTSQAALAGLRAAACVPHQFLFGSNALKAIHMKLTTVLGLAVGPTDTVTDISLWWRSHAESYEALGRSRRTAAADRRWWKKALIALMGEPTTTIAQVRAFVRAHRDLIKPASAPMVGVILTACKHRPADEQEPWWAALAASNDLDLVPRNDLWLHELLERPDLLAAVAPHTTFGKRSGRILIKAAEQWADAARTSQSDAALAQWPKPVAWLISRPSLDPEAMRRLHQEKYRLLGDTVRLLAHHTNVPAVLTAWSTQHPAFATLVVALAVNAPETLPPKRLAQMARQPNAALALQHPAVVRLMLQQAVVSGPPPIAPTEEPPAQAARRRTM